MTELSQTPWPTELKRASDHQSLTVSFENGQSFCFSAEYLRVHSPSAEVQGHSPEQKVLVAGKRQVRIENIQRVGSYAVRLLFSDGHQTGIFSWAYFYEHGPVMAERFAAYEQELSEKGLSRD